MKSPTMKIEWVEIDHFNHACNTPYGCMLRTRHSYFTPGAVLVESVDATYLPGVNARGRGGVWVWVPAPGVTP
jgi:hypothetical protein